MLDLMDSLRMDFRDQTSHQGADRRQAEIEFRAHATDPLRESDAPRALSTAVRGWTWSPFATLCRPTTA